MTTTSHTPGRLKVQHPHAGNRGWEIAFEPGLEQVCQNVTEANARRLVACWNACEGLDTDKLERFGLGTAFGSEIFELRAQRDELLEAVNRLLSWERTGHQVRSEDIAFAQQAIARVEGGAA